MRVKTLSEFKNKLKGGAARPNLFEVHIPKFPGAVKNQPGRGGGGAGKKIWDKDEREDFNFLCKAAQIPASTVAAVEIPFRGRILKVAGDRTFADWTITVINDENFKLRSRFEAWSNAINRLNNGMGPTRPSSYMCKGIVKQLGRGNEQNDRDGVGPRENAKQEVLRTYEFFDIWPNNISEIDLNYDSTNAYEEFQVTFSVQYVQIGRSANKNGKNKEKPFIR